MQISKAEFVTSAVTPDQYPKAPFPNIAMVGRSNVGKSSLINYVCNNFKLARTSGTPGKTRLINFYNVNDNLFLVDLPGYGFAQVFKQEQKKWGEMIETYLSQTQKLALIILLVDIRHSPTTGDIQMVEWIRYYGYPFVIVATKADKIGKSRWNLQADKIRTTLNIPKIVPVIPFSSQARLGREKLLATIEESILNFNKRNNNQ